MDSDTRPWEGRGRGEVTEGRVWENVRAVEHGLELMYNFGNTSLIGQM